MCNETTRGLQTPVRQAVSTPNTDGAILVDNGFARRGCEFAAPTCEEFRVDGLAMECPDCGSTRVEHEFEEAGQ